MSAMNTRPPASWASLTSARTTVGWVMIAFAGSPACKRLGLTSTLCPGCTKRDMPPRSSTAWRTAASIRSVAYSVLRTSATVLSMLLFPGGHACRGSGNNRECPPASAASVSGVTPGFWFRQNGSPPGKRPRKPAPTRGQESPVRPGDHRPGRTRAGRHRRRQ